MFKSEIQGNSMGKIHQIKTLIKQIFLETRIWYEKVTRCYKNKKYC